jgi:hypothetical protein
MHTLLRRICPRPPDPYHWKAEDLSFLHVLLVWGVNLASLLKKERQSWTIHLKQTVDGISGRADKEISDKIMLVWIMDTKREICPKTITLLLCKLMDNHQTCSTPITSPKRKKSVASNDITNQT